jgi:ABC-type multidrug transport system permease subunit
MQYKQTFLDGLLLNVGEQSCRLIGKISAITERNLCMANWPNYDAEKIWIIGLIVTLVGLGLLLAIIRSAFGGGNGKNKP